MESGYKSFLSTSLWSSLMANASLGFYLQLFWFFSGLLFGFDIVDFPIMFLAHPMDYNYR